jgi:hypothetical protein
VNKLWHLQWAEAIDSYRIIPRVFLAVCLSWTIWVSYLCLMWYFHLPAGERGLEASGFGSVVFLTVFGFLRLVYSTYSENGRNWNQTPSSTIATTSTVTQVNTP